jgi:hypothetical protein
MARWVKATGSISKEPVLINLDLVAALFKHHDGSTVIMFGNGRLSCAEPIKFFEGELWGKKQASVGGSTS